MPRSALQSDSRRTPRRAWLALLALVLAAGWTALFMLSLRERGAGDGRRTAAVEEEPAQASAELTAATPMEVAAEELPTREPTADAGPSQVRGRLSVVDADGVEHTPAPGELSLYFEEPGVSTGFLVEHAQGRFTLEAEPGCVISSDPLPFRDGFAFLTGAPQRILPADGPLVLRYAVPPALSLVVTDARTGRELGLVEVIGECTDPRRPPAGHWLKLRRDSPVPLSLMSPETLWVGSPGYAWREVAVDPRGGGPVEVELTPGGAVEFLAPGGDNWKYTPVSVGPLSSPESTVALFRGLGKRSRVDGLAAGWYVVHVGDPRATECWEAFQVEAGRTTEVLLDPSAPRRRGTPVRVIGVLALPLRMDARGLELAFLPADGGLRKEEDSVAVDEMEPRPDGLAFEADLRPGLYSWSVEALGVRGKVVIPPEEEHQLTLRLPAIATVAVELPDGQPAELAEAYLTWSSPLSARPFGRHWFYAGFEGSARVTFQAPVGPIELEVITPTRGTTRIEADVPPGGCYLPVRPPPRTGVRVYARAEDKRPVDPFVDVIPLGHGGRVSDWGEADDDALTWMFVDRPGRYRVECDLVWGYAPPEPIEVELRPGVTENVVFELSLHAMRRP